MKVVLYHLTGNENVKAVAYGLAEANLLLTFYVSIASFPKSLVEKNGSFRILSEIKRRGFNPIIQQYTKLWPWLELGRMGAAKLSLGFLTESRRAPFHIDSVCKNLDRHVASKLPLGMKQGAKAVYSYEDIAAFSFMKAKQIGIKCLYDLPIGYWRTAREILEKEKERWPDWALTMPGLDDSSNKLQRKDDELKMADHIFVASSFTASTLKHFPGSLAPLHVIPYGFPPAATLARSYINANSSRRLKLLFVGSMTQRKGIANLFEAINGLESYVELTLVGTKLNDKCIVLNETLNKYTWLPSLPHNHILTLMRESDVLMFPSLFEGFGLVITEAMSQGTPVITTQRTAGPDIIEHGHNGWIVEAGSTDALREAIQNLIKDKKLIQDNGREALETAKLRPWAVYGEELSNAVGKIINSSTVV